MDKRVVWAAVSLLALATPAAAQLAPGAVWTDDRPDAHAPIGVPHGQLLEAGRIMIGYRYAYHRLDNLRQGTTQVDPDAAFQVGYTLVPTAMNVHRHVAEVMYAPRPMVTFAVELPVVHQNLWLERQSGDRTEVTASGLGDVRIGALVGALDRDGTRAHASLMLGLPTGSREEWDEQGPFPYAAHVGSGTFDINPGATIVHQTPLWSWGGQVHGTVRVGEGSDGFALGNRLELTAWTARQLARTASVSLRLAGQFRGDVRHDVPTFPASPASEPGLTGGTRVDLIAGGNLHAAAGTFLGHRLFGEIGIPVYQDLDGPQLGSAWHASIGWRWLLGPS